MSRTWLVAGREFTERIRSRAFLISNGAILAVLLLAVGLPYVLNDDEPFALGHVGDEAEQVGQLAIAQQEAFDLEVELTGVEDRDAAEEALLDGALDAVLLDATT